jgi:hypothetical protein
MKISNRKTITVVNDSTAAAVSSFSANIYIPFQPDEVIVRQASVYDLAGGNHIIIVTSDLVDNYPLFTINDEIITIPLSTRFIINRPITGTFTFNFLNVDQTNSNLQIEIAFVLEFIKY